MFSPLASAPCANSESFVGGGSMLMRIERILMPLSGPSSAWQLSGFSEDPDAYCYEKK